MQREPVGPLGLGLAALGRPGYINLGHAADLGHEYSVGGMEAHAHAVLDAAWAGGIRYFDAARSYGRAEAFLASWLASRHIDPGAVSVGSKWGYTYTAGWQVDARQHEVKEHSLAVLQRQLAESRQLLGNYLTLYQIHSATLDSGVLANGEVLTELARQRDLGLLIGLSLSGAAQAETLQRALDITVDGLSVFASVQATWNLLDPSAAPALQAAHQAGLLVIIKEALANGRLTPRNEDPGFQPQMRLLARTAAARGTTVDALALAAAIAQPWSGVVLSGAATVAQVKSNLGALSLVWDEGLQATLSELAEPPAVYWQKRSQMAWN